MEKYNIGDVWWVHFPYSEKEEIKRRPAIIIDDDTIAILAMYVTTKNKENNPYCIKIEDWKETGLKKESWTRIDKIVKVSEWNMDCKIGELSQRDLTKIMQLVKEILSQKFHEFSIIAIKNKNGEFLQKYDERWKSWLFPYVRSAENNKESVDCFTSSLLNEKIVTEYVTNSKHCKYSVSDDVYKIYNHKLYKLELNKNSYIEKEESFVIDGNKYKWMSIVEMEKDDRIMEVNDEIVAFVKKNLFEERIGI